MPIGATSRRRVIARHELTRRLSMRWAIACSLRARSASRASSLIPIAVALIHAREHLLQECERGRRLGLRDVGARVGDLHHDVAREPLPDRTADRLARQDADELIADRVRTSSGRPLCARAA